LCLSPFILFPFVLLYSPAALINRGLRIT
jgi:hypothetical protein